MKFKEVCQIHAESYSSAEVLHGPVSIVDRAFPVLAFAAADPAEDAVVEVADNLTGMGARVFVTSDKVKKATALPFERTGHWITDPITSVVSFYGLVEHMASLRRDRPGHTAPSEKGHGNRMTGALTAYTGGPIFDGRRLLTDHAALFDGKVFRGVALVSDVDAGSELVDLGGDILSPGFVDLQVNGGGGIMLNDDQSVATVRRIAAAHRDLGTVALLPTLITDTREKTTAAIAAVEAALCEGAPGIAGLHLEGPHLSVARKGAHDAAFIRPMEESDLAMLTAAAKSLPALMVTIAPENVTVDQVTALRRAGAIVSLGHSDADFATAMRYVAAGARCATHLFNAMSQLGNREPGLVGAVLASGKISAGLIADGIHVHPEAMRAAWAAKAGPGEIFLVSDAMAVAGTEETSVRTWRSPHPSCRRTSDAGKRHIGRRGP